MDDTRISQQDLALLVDELVAAGVEVVAPARTRTGRIDYFFVRSLAEAVLDGEPPRGSLKPFFLPPTEPLFSWRQRRGDVELEEVSASFPPRVVLGARPCDAAALEVLDRVMGWDYRDEPYFGRRAATTMVSLVCTSGDDACFCSAVGLGPDARRGADLLLSPSDGGYRVGVTSAKGEALVAAQVARFAGPAPEPAIPAPRGAGIDPQAVRAWLEGHFEHPLWQELALRCHGCGACAAVCPTCHCFDIVDEPDGVGHGTRRRNWDTCQAGRFTVHASGHNPRADQGARFRQRIMHKLAIYPKRFGEVLCTGCGRCVRACPAGQDLPEILTRITAMATGAAV